MSGLGVPTRGSPAGILHRVGVSPEHSVNLLPPSNGRASLGRDFLKKAAGGISRVSGSAHHTTPPWLLPPGVRSQSNPAVARTEPGNLYVIKVSLSNRNAVKMSTVKGSPARLVTCAGG